MMQYKHNRVHIVVGGDATELRENVVFWVKTSLKKRKMTYDIYSGTEWYRFLRFPNSAEKLEVPIPIISIGGDGTMISALKYGFGLPVVGINTGTLGYLTEIEPKKKAIDSAIARIRSGKYFTQYCKTLEYNIWHKGKKVAEGRAVNDVVLARDNAIANIVFDAHSGGRFIHRYSADGMVIASSIGASAYALSCGAPIIEPSSNIICMSPIAPHSLNSRSMVFDSRARIELFVRRCRNEEVKTIACADGRDEYELEEGDSVRVFMGKHDVACIYFDCQAAYERLARRLS